MELLQYSSGMKSKKWWPTVQQKQILEGMWASGVRKPSEDQIAEITAVLQQHGRVKTKSVFYWFRNESGRDKIRRQQTAASRFPLDIVLNVVIYYLMSFQPLQL